jgi:hypothetical protein
VTSADGRIADVLAALLAATPEPPDDADPETVLETSSAILSASAPLIAQLREAIGGGALPPELAAEVTALHERTSRWLALAEAARRETGDSLRRIAQARQYQQQR